MRCRPFSRLFFFNDTATTEIYTLSLHDALPILFVCSDAIFMCSVVKNVCTDNVSVCTHVMLTCEDRKSTRLNSSHDQISYAVFCLKKKKKCRTPDRARRYLRH